MKMEFQNLQLTTIVLTATRWYDNEWGYSNRCVDLTLYIGNKLQKSSSEKVAAKV
jgi:glyceraldehyde-3-phosphate dehydrogenase/erythrose-4-phosphate dehydrogenase